MKTSPCVVSAAARNFHFAPVVLSLFLAATGVTVASPAQGKGQGKGQGHSADFVPPGQSDKSVPPGHRRAPVEFVVTKAPPPVRVEVVPARPAATHVWVAGYWSGETETYIWLPGVWVAPPEPAAIWVSPRFEARSSVSIFISGYWKI